MARILIVEDDKSINNLIRRNLELVGHDCVCVFDGEAVFASIEAQTTDLILLDIMLPRLDGFTVLAELRNEIPVIFLTARSAIEDRVKGLKLGADDYIVKPFIRRSCWPGWKPFYGASRKQTSNSSWATRV